MATDIADQMAGSEARPTSTLVRYAVFLVSSIAITTAVTVTVPEAVPRIADLIVPPPVMTAADALRQGAGMMAEEDQERSMQLRKLTTLAVSALFAAGMFGLASGLVGRSFGWAIAGLLIGIIMGPLFAYLAHQLNYLVLSRAFDAKSDYSGLVMASVAYAGIGLAAGLAVATARRFRGVAQLSVAGVLAGALGAAAFYILVSIFMPEVNTDLPFPDVLTHRILWSGIPAVVMAVLLAHFLAPAPAPGREDQNSEVPAT